MCIAIISSLKHSCLYISTFACITCVSDAAIDNFVLRDPNCKILILLECSLNSYFEKISSFSFFYCIKKR